LHRIGSKYPDSWHYQHMVDPTITSPGSIMPAYPWLFEQTINKDLTAGKINAMRTVGVPYVLRYEEIANQDLERQAKKIADELNAGGYETTSDAEIVALIAYLQRLGTDIKVD